MECKDITSEGIQLFFNKYKYNTDLITRLERNLLRESYDFPKWEKSLTENSQQTRKFFRESETLLNQYIFPVIKNPEQLSKQSRDTLLNQIVFFLFENNNDSLITEDVLNALLSLNERLSPENLFYIYMNLAVTRTLSLRTTEEDVIGLYDKALEIYPTLESTTNYDIKIHLIFARTYELLALCLFKSTDYVRCVRLYDEIKDLLANADIKLLLKMWPGSTEFKPKLDLLLRFFRIYGIYTAGISNFQVTEENSAENRNALTVMTSWLVDEYMAEESEGEINHMIFCYYWKFLYSKQKISETVYVEKLKERLEVHETFIFPEMSFPDDTEPVNVPFSQLLDRMKLFSHTFSYYFIYLEELFVQTKDLKEKRALLDKFQDYFNHSVYAEKGFDTDGFVMDLLTMVSPVFKDIDEFIDFMQTIFIRRQISTAIHIEMVSFICAVCIKHFFKARPDLFLIEGRKRSEEEIMHFIKNAALLHDIGKLKRTNLINLHYRKITDEEYSQIQGHATDAIDLIEQVPVLSAYRDFIVGHHKYWDDQQGYPESFMLKDCKIPHFVGLMTICDCIDTATDFRGRNYTNLKTFDDILNELIAQKTVRYDPELVELIEEDKELQQELCHITSDGRNHNSYQTYLQFILPHTTFKENDERIIESAAPEMFDCIYDCLLASYREADREKLKANLKALMSNKENRIYLIKTKSNQVLGLFAGNIHSPLSGASPYFFINEVVIRPEYRRLGFATELMIYASDSLRKENIHKMVISTENDFSSESFLWISGFQKSDRYLMEKEIV